ncbi:hypothetical protein TKK_0003009 [Trichogramma kaykai]
MGHNQSKSEYQQIVEKQSTPSFTAAPARRPATSKSAEQKENDWQAFQDRAFAWDRKQREERERRDMLDKIDGSIKKL